MFGARWTGHLHIETEGTYTFFMNSDDGSLLYLNQTLVVNNVPGNTIKSGNHYMYAGAYEVSKKPLLPPPTSKLVNYEQGRLQ
eukprot:3780370-Amphidinium_carterae.1